MKREKNVFNIFKVIAFLFICIISLCASDCADGVGAVLQAAGIAGMASRNENVQTAGALAWITGQFIEMNRSSTTNYDPGIYNSYRHLGIETHNAIVDNRNRNAERQARVDEIRAEGERQRQESAARFAEHDRTLPLGTSSITSSTGNQNVGNPQVNNLATADGVIISANRDPRRGNANINNNRSLTGRNDQSANPNAANNTESRAQGAGGQRVGGDISNQQTTTNTTQQTSQVSGATVARSAATPQQMAQVIANSIADREQPSEPRSPPQPTVRQQIPQQVRPETYIVQGIDWLDPNARIPTRNGNFIVKDAIYLQSWDLYHIPTENEINNIMRMAHELQRLRNNGWGPININSWLRPTSVNPGRLNSETGKITRDLDAKYTGTSLRTRRDGDSSIHNARGANYNSWIGGVSGSSHTTGLAVDIINSRGIELERWLNENWEGGVGSAFSRTVSPKGFTHIDLNRNPGRSTQYRRWDYGTAEPR
ncbi:MAG: D-Ala-D-Ala carboxypeptidase family metallohydrolase [Treponema sp.]|nr:D-Ala-D-Ala carboxypeptidase family metallohydrolase [Treponema sp.]